MPRGASGTSASRETSWQDIDNNLVIKSLLSLKMQAPNTNQKVDGYCVQAGQDMANRPTPKRAAASKALSIDILSISELELLLG